MLFLSRNASHVPQRLAGNHFSCRRGLSMESESELFIFYSLRTYALVKNSRQ
jgi:hypothetical protein